MAAAFKFWQSWLKCTWRRAFHAKAHWIWSSNNKALVGWIALIGYQVAGILGLLVSVLALNLPGLCFSLMGYKLLTHWQSPVAAKLIIIVQYGALALLAAASFSIASSVIKQHFSPVLFILAIVFFILLALFDLPPFLGLLVFIGLGYVGASIF